MKCEKRENGKKIESSEENIKNLTEKLGTLRDMVPEIVTLTQD